MTDPGKKKSVGSPMFDQQMLLDALEMAAFASIRGLKQPGRIASELSEIAKKATTGQGVTREVGIEIAGEDLGKLASIHASLSELVSPATPSSIRFTKGAYGLWSSMRTIPMLGAMTVAGIISITLYIIVCIYEPSKDSPASTFSLLTQLKMLASAGLGASFYSLFTANRYIVSRTYDPTYTVVYWTRFLLGIISGIILANIILENPSTLISNGEKAAVSPEFLKQLGPSTLALLGGYSSNAVNKILHRIVEMLVTLVEGNAKELVQTQQEQMKTKLDSGIRKEKLNMAIELANIFTESGSKNPDVKKLLDKLVNGLNDGKATTQT